MRLNGADRSGCQNGDLTSHTGGCLPLFSPASFPFVTYPMRHEQIHAAVRILKREIRRWQEPVVGVVAKESDRDPFLILISTLLSLRTKDKTTREAGDRLFAMARTPAAMLQLPLKKLERVIYPVGFYRTKAKAIHQICRRLIDEYGARSSRTRSMS